MKNKILLLIILLSYLVGLSCTKIGELKPRANPFDPENEYYGENAKEFQADSNTVALWHLNEDSGSTVKCEIDNIHNIGIVTGTSIVDGRFNKARKYNINSSFITVSSSNLGFGQNDFTIEMWVKIEKYLDINGHLFEFNGIYWDIFTAGSQSALFNDSTTIIWYGGWIQGTTSSESQLDIFINHNSWLYFALVKKGNNLNVYINSLLNGYAVLKLSYNDFGTVGNLKIGRNTNSGNSFIIDEVRISDKARTEEEIQGYWMGK